jgi:hypothetical protein
MADHIEYSVDEDYEILEDGLSDDPPGSGSLLPPGGWNLGPSGPCAHEFPTIGERTPWIGGSH